MVSYFHGKLHNFHFFTLPLSPEPSSRNSSSVYDPQRNNGDSLDQSTYRSALTFQIGILKPTVEKSSDERPGFLRQELSTWMRPGLLPHLLTRGVKLGELITGFTKDHGEEKLQNVTYRSCFLGWGRARRALRGRILNTWGPVPWPPLGGQHYDIREW